MIRTRNRARALALSILGASAACSTPPGSSSSSPPPASSSAAAAAVTLPRNVHPLARADHDLGRVTGELLLDGVSLVMKPSAAQVAARDALLAAQLDPASPQYHQWLTPEGYAAQFGASAADLARMTAWLEAQGLAVEGPSRTGTQLFFRGTAAQIERAFQTELHHYDVLGTRHFAMSRAPSLPGDFADRVHGIHGLHDFRKHARRRAHHPLVMHPFYDAGASAGLFMGPKDFSAIYDVGPLYAAGIDGTGQSIVVVGQTYIEPDDLSTFRTTFGLPAKAPTYVLVPNSGAQAVNGDEDEADIDLEWSGAVAKGADIIFVYTGDSPNSNGVDDSLAYAINHDLAPIISMSYGGCDLFLTANANLDSEIAAAANLLGITVVAASGDSGAAGCVDFGLGGLQVGPPASLPGVVAVGGSEFPASTQAPPYWDLGTGTALEYIPETAWNDSDPTIGAAGLSSTGGGPSTVFPKPFWQVGVTPADKARDVPDVSLNASNQNTPYAVQSQGDLYAYGGTSCSTPAFAGILALVNHALTKKGDVGRLGNANPMIYALNKSTPAAFHDVTTGDNKSACVSSDPDCPASGSYGGFTAGVGYDLVTGLGSVDANKLVTAWAALAPTTTALQVSASTTTVGAPITLTASVGSASTSNSITGTVSFTFVTYDVDGGTNDSWLLGTVNVTAGLTGGKETASAVLSTAIPPGISGKADVVAMYDGDKNYLASQSAKSSVTVTGSTFTVAPPGPLLRPNMFQQFFAMNGKAPFVWQIVRDSTCNSNYSACAQVDQTGLYQAGPVDGETVVQVVDANGADAFATVTVAGPPVDAGTFPDAGPPDTGTPDAATPDSGTDGGPADSGTDGGIADSGVDAAPPSDAGPIATDAGPIARDGGSPVNDGGAAKDAGPAPGTDGGGAVADAGGGGTGDDSGCGCVVAGGTDRESGLGALAGALLGLAALGRRRRARR